MKSRHEEVTVTDDRSSSSGSPSSHLKARQEKLQKLIHMQRQQQHFLQQQLLVHSSSNHNHTNNNDTSSNKNVHSHDVGPLTITSTTATEQQHPPSTVVQTVPPQDSVRIDFHHAPTSAFVSSSPSVTEAAAATASSTTDQSNLAHTYSYQSLSDYKMNHSSNIHHHNLSPHTSFEGGTHSFNHHLRIPHLHKSTLGQQRQHDYRDVSYSTQQQQQEPYNTNDYSMQSQPDFIEYPSSTTSSSSPYSSLLSCWSTWVLQHAFFSMESLQKSFCFGAIDGMLTGSGITAACAGLGILPIHYIQWTSSFFYFYNNSTIPMIPSTDSTTTNNNNNVHSSFFSLFINNTPPSCLLVLALCIAACISDAICIAIGHIWSTRVLLHAHSRRKKEELQSFYYFQNDSKARLATSFMSRGMLKIDAVTIVDVLSGYPELFVNALVSDSQAMGVSIFGSVHNASTNIGTSNQGGNSTVNPSTIIDSSHDHHPHPYPPHNMSSHYQSRSTENIPNYYSSNYGSVIDSTSMHVESKSSNPIHNLLHGRFESEPIFNNSRKSDTDHNQAIYCSSDSPLYQHTSSSNDPYQQQQHAAIQDHHQYYIQSQQGKMLDTNEDDDYAIPTVETSLVHKVTQESWMEGFCIMISFSLFSILPCMLYVAVSFMLHFEHEQIDIVTTVAQRTSSSNGGTHTYPYSATNSMYPEYISPTSITLIVSSITMFLLGVWKR